MENTILFGNGINRVSNHGDSWDDLLVKLKGVNRFENDELPNTMVYERIFMERHQPSKKRKTDELQIKEEIAKWLSKQASNTVFDLLASFDIKHYLTTNYDYTFEKALGEKPEKLSTEEIYSLRRKRRYKVKGGYKYLWNIHGEIDSPKSIMLGLDHYCGSLSKLDLYVKGGYQYVVNGEVQEVEPMIKKLGNNSFCCTSWVDFFFCSNVHIFGLSLNYSETDLWWVLNKRARLVTEGLVNNEIYFYTDFIDEEKAGLLKSFGVKVITEKVMGNDYKSIYLKLMNRLAN